WQRIGDVVVVRLPAELGPDAEGVGNAYARVLKARAVVDIRRIAGELREPEGRVIHGKSAETVHRENGILYSLDAARLMFSKGNKAERERMGRIVKPGERVLDMFAGIGYFTLPIAVKARPETVVAIEKNPLSFGFLRKNIGLNKVERRVEAVNTDCRDVKVVKVVGSGSRFDRAILGYIPDSGETREGFAGAWEFLPTAARALRPGGVAHFHCLAGRGVRKMPPVEGFRERGMRVVKSYGPETFHVVVDLVRI
ncbi:MAG TPA: class I SAM-dependent methyltransferase family protein, partial [Thermoplasmata archaeon]|nr:class I SAM-dependent methyltransferase family protein [Thermoplasmata archaeon]